MNSQALSGRAAGDRVRDAEGGKCIHDVGSRGPMLSACARFGAASLSVARTSEGFQRTLNAAREIVK